MFEKLQKMGCCCSKRNREDDSIPLSNIPNTCVTSKVGKVGSNVRVTPVSSNGSFLISGNGTAVGSCILECDSAYWEVKIGDKPEGLCIGVKRFDDSKSQSLDGYLDNESDKHGEEAWCLHGVTFVKDDVVGVYWDQIDRPMLSFSLNGVALPQASHTRVRPANNIVPAVSVHDGSTCSFIFDEKHFLFPPKSSRYGMIVCATSLI
jgi:hypothetical protein